VSQTPIPIGFHRKLIEKSMAKIEYRGEIFDGYNKPKRTPSHPRNSHAVLAKEGDRVKLIRFGQQGVKGAGSNPKSAKQKPVKSLLRPDMRPT
jgi:hypothetical protein